MEKTDQCDIMITCFVLKMYSYLFMPSTNKVSEILIKEYLQYADFVGKKRSTTQYYPYTYKRSLKAMVQALTDMDLKASIMEESNTILKIGVEIPQGVVEYLKKMMIYIRKNDENGVNILIGISVGESANFAQHKRFMNRIFK